MLKKSLVACSIIAASNTALAERYVNGVEGIKAASVPGPGVYFRSYNLYYSANDLKDGSGNNVNNGFDLAVAAIVARPIWVTRYKLLGGTYFNDLVVPLVYKKLKIDTTAVDDDTSGIGDIYLEPFGLAWHGKQWDSAIAFGVFLDNGPFNSVNSVNLGTGYKTYMLTAGGTQYYGSNNDISLSLLARYETHNTQNDTNIESGDDFHFEYGLGFTPHRGLDVGISGYYQQQMTNDHGAGTTPDKDRVFAIGPEVSQIFTEQKWLVSLRALKEVNAKNRQEGSIVNLTLTKIF